MAKTCPHCLAVLGHDVSYARNEHGRLEEGHPTPGDITVCHECGEFLEFSEDGTLIKVTDQEKLDSLKDHPDAQAAQKMVRFMKSNKDNSEGYANQIKTMAESAKAWVKEHPEKTPIQMQRASTSKVGIIATLPEAIEHSLVAVNDHAKDMFTELGWLDMSNLTVPTVFMAEIAIETAFKPHKDVDER